jgi:hypothetical protein
MSGKNLKKNYKKTASKSGSKNQVRQNKFGKVKLELPAELHDKIEAEKNPNDIAAEALFAYYRGQNRRNEAAVQKEIDNSIIEIQRRHISDLKDQLTVSNKNYEELMRTYQAYMLQVQPMIEAAQKKEIEAKKTTSENSDGNEKQSENAGENSAGVNLSQSTSKTKKWYVFWK